MSQDNTLLTTKRVIYALKIPISLRIKDEIWKPCTQSSNYYVSNFGRVWSKLTSIILSSNPRDTGYIVYHLRIGVRL